ncbi:MAG: TetR/AcrR family transcriptional regulator, partial [Cellulomonadaceae bacterium]|nr:TetR/AcrR family transcriptional regulator [Cellulomonadaceae bacterium]
VDLTIEASAFVEMVVDARRTLARPDDLGRLRALVDTTLPRAQAAGLADPGLTTTDVLIAQRMVFGVVVTAGPHDDVRGAVDRALSLLRPIG